VHQPANQFEVEIHHNIKHDEIFLVDSTADAPPGNSNTLNDKL
jgi:hypothetical protein